MTTEESRTGKAAGEVASSFLPGAGWAISELFTAVRREWNTNRSVALATAVRTSGLSREDLAERIEQDPALVPLVTRLLWEAAMTGQAPLLEAMGAAFGAAVEDRVRSSDYELIPGGLRNLRGEDVEVLRHLRDRTIFHKQAEQDQFNETTDMQSVSGMASRTGLEEEALVFALGRLVNQGFATFRSVLGGARYDVSGLGALLCDALQQMREGGH